MTLTDNMIKNSEINRINQYLREQLWMDFEMCNMNGGELELYGYLDEAGETKIKIIFELPYMVSCNFFFTYEGGRKDFISIVDGEEEYQMNKKYGITQGNSIFKITNVNAETDMFIAAQGIKAEITD